MIAAAVIAVGLSVALPVGKRLAWLYHNSYSNLLNPADVDFRTVASSSDAALPFGRPVVTQCSYRCRVGSRVPSGLIYRFRIEAKLIHADSGFVRETRRWTHHLIAGQGTWSRVRRTTESAWTPPRPGPYLVQYEIYVTDLFGRTSKNASTRDDFVVR